MKDSKICTTCGKDVLLVDYYSQPRSADGKAYRCKECVKAIKNKKLADKNKTEWGRVNLITGWKIN